MGFYTSAVYTATNSTLFLLLFNGTFYRLVELG